MPAPADIGATPDLVDEVFLDHTGMHSDFVYDRLTDAQERPGLQSWYRVSPSIMHLTIAHETIA